MALGGGTWLTQNKVLPGSYINFSSVAKASATLSDRGYIACPLFLRWGPEGEVFTVTNGDFQKNSLKIFGYSFDAPEMLPLREIFKHATVLYAYRLGGSTEKATCTYATAKYGGTRGNALKIVIAKNVDDETKWNVQTILDGEVIDVQTVASASELKSNDFVDFKTNASLTATAGTPLTGGTDIETPTGTHYQAALDAFESYSFNVLCCPASDAATVGLFAAYTARMRDEVGAKFQLVAWKPQADYEGVIGVWNAVSESSNTVLPSAMATALLVYWVAGAEAGCMVNKSLTNHTYDGELTVDTDYTQMQLEAAIKAGKFFFHNVNGTVKVLDDINTLITVSDTKGDIFKANQTMRVCDQIANDMAVVFNTRYLGKVANDSAGREALWSDVVKLMRDLESIRAVEGFDEKIVTCEKGDTSGAVVLTVDGLTIVNAMKQLYMSVIIQ